MKLYLSIIATLVLGTSTAWADSIPVAQGQWDQVSRDRAITLDLAPGLTAQTWFYFDQPHRRNRLASLIEVDCVQGAYRVLHNKEYQEGQLRHDSGPVVTAEWQQPRPGSVARRFVSICP